MFKWIPVCGTAITPLLSCMVHLPEGSSLHYTTSATPNALTARLTADETAMHFDLVLRCFAVYLRQRPSELCTLHDLSGVPF